MKFWYFDIAFLIVFSLLVFLFLRSRKKNLKREGIFYLYRTKKGLKFMDKLARFFKPILDPVGWVSITLGFAMLVGIVYLFIQTIFITSQVPINAPPFLPLLPYLPQAFKLPLPPFYFIYWILIIAIVAITHEFSHGVFARHNKIKLKSTGFGFLGPFLTAFVEPDEKQMEKKSKKAQLQVFSAGTFSNLIFAVIFLLILQLFFVLAYQPAGIAFMPAYSPVNISEIESIGNYSAEEFLSLSDKELSKIENTLAVKTDNETYYLDQSLIYEIPLARKIIKKYGTLTAYENAPAFNSGMQGGIEYINEDKIKSSKDITISLEKYSPEDKVTITTSEGTYDVTLSNHPNDKEKAYLGIFSIQKPKTFGGIVNSLTTPYFNPEIYVEARGNEDVTIFFRDLLKWLVLVCFLVALFNMLPVVILDGGKMFYIAILGITKSKKAAKIALTIASYFILALVIIMFIVWIAA